MTFPQKGVLFPSQPKVAFVEVHITPDVFEDDARLSCLVQSIASVPVVVKPPFTPTPGGDESILSFAGRLSETLNPNDFALVFAVSTEKVSYFIPGPAPEGMTTFQERSSADGKHHFPKTGGDIFFHIKSGIQAEEKGSIDQMIYHIKEKLKAFSEHVYVRKAFNGASGRNQFGFFDGGSNPKVTANPVLPLGPYDKAYTKVIDVKNAFEKVDESIKKDFTTEEIVTSLERKQEAEKKELGKLVDLGSFHTSFIESGTHAGGSFIIWQEWQHNGLDKFNKLDETDQNNVFGRDKKTGGFLPTGKSHGGNNPPLLFGRNDPLAGDINKTYPNSHIVRTHVRMTNIHAETADVNPLIQNNPGASTAPLQITRQGSPFYDEEKGIKGLGFLAYAKDTLRYDQILDRMIGKNVTWPKKGDTSVDSLLNFSKPVRGGYFYVPNMLEINAMIQKVSYDVAIIGGGVSGLFSALRLKENDCNLKVAVFESDNHVGGRLVSIPAPQTDNRIITEFGGMRFPNKFHYTNKIVNELELETIEFPVDKDVNPFYVRGKNGKLESLKKPKRAKEIFNMRNVSSDDIDGGLFIPLLAHLGWNKEAPTDRLGRHELRTFLKTVRLDADGKLSASVGTGELLSEMSIHQLWMKVYGLEALKYQVAISGYFSPWGDWNAIDAIVDNLSDFGQDVKYFRLKDGYQSLVKKMTEKFRGMGGEVFLGKKLSSFSKRGNNAFYLDFGEDNPLVASNLILAMPRKCLSSIESASLATPEVQKMIQSVKPKPFFKLFLCYERVWWDKSLTGRSITTLPIRQCYYWQIDKETGRAVIMFYDDGSNPEFWSAILDRDRDPDVQDTWEDNRVAENVKLEAHRQFAKLQGKDPESVPKPYAASCASWSGESKFGGGVNFWLPKVDSQKIIDAIIQPIPNARLFICGSAYSNYQGWVEGALETADCMLTKKFNLKPFLSPLDNLKIHVNNLSKKVDKVYFEMSVAKKEERSNEEDGQWKVIYKSEEKKVEKASASWDGLGVVLEAQAKKLSSGRTQDGDYSAVDNTPMKISFLLIKFGRFLPSSRKCKVQTYETTAHDLINKAQRADKLFKNSKITVEFTST
eukprot:CAMPEP_0172524918 /NCGR_PEP_ID=MMETSP1066-20121228/294444_1 /TAXON_ID=671091 /ORGANISM="Coscinodiscus wailesii, Strain CCMP2513" /LENGTH=1094 /DNA_ID=CAMNT_0013308075 /DNA_START=61 /DNA_END=3345 /DNA_ORIENTATION=+